MLRKLKPSFKTLNAEEIKMSIAQWYDSVKNERMTSPVFQWEIVKGDSPIYQWKVETVDTPSLKL